MYDIVGDYAAQAVINTMLGHAFPDDPIVGEEDAEEIRDPSATYIRERVVALANQTLTRGVDGENEENGYNSAWGVGGGNGKVRAVSELMDAIDKGNHPGGRTGRECFPLCG